MIFKFKENYHCKLLLDVDEYGETSFYNDFITANKLTIAYVLRETDDYFDLQFPDGSCIYDVPKDKIEVIKKHRYEKGSNCKILDPTIHPVPFFNLENHIPFFPKKSLTICEDWDKVDTQ